MGDVYRTVPRLLHLECLRRDSSSSSGINGIEATFIMDCEVSSTLDDGAGPMVSDSLYGCSEAPGGMWLALALLLSFHPTPAPLHGNIRYNLIRSLLLINNFAGANPVVSKTLFQNHLCSSSKTTNFFSKDQPPTPPFLLSQYHPLPRSCLLCSPKTLHPLLYQDFDTHACSSKIMPSHAVLCPPAKTCPLLLHHSATPRPHPYPNAPPQLE
eukprot:g36152.t1